MADLSPQQSLHELALAFPKFIADVGPGRAQSVVELYGRKLDDIPGDVLAAAVDELIKTENWFPTIATIRSVCAERMLGLPDEGEALVQIEERMAWRRGGPTAGEPPKLNWLVSNVLNVVGGFSAFRSTLEPAVIRGQFGRLYREARAREIRQCQVDPLALMAGEETPELPVARDAVS